MRTTITLDEDVAEKLEAEMQKSGASFNATVNEILRRGLNTKTQVPDREHFRVSARDLGRLRPGLSLDNIVELLEQLEGQLTDDSCRCKCCSRHLLPSDTRA